MPGLSRGHPTFDFWFPSDTALLYVSLTFASSLLQDLLAHETVVSQVLPHTATQPDLRYALFFTILGDGEERARLRRHLQHVVQGRAAFDPLILTRMEEDAIEA